MPPTDASTRAQQRSAPPADRWSGGWVVVVPVKPPARGKSRLEGLPDDLREAYAAAFALDTVAAALATPGVAGVLAVTDDHRFAARLAGLGCGVLPDGVSGDLNATLVQGAAEGVRRWPGAAPVALCADLPALVPDDLAAALASWSPGAPAFVADAAGTGTTMYVARPDAFAPRFGPGSASAHAAAGAVPLPGDLASLRQDVDEVGDLGRALLLGVGPATRDAAGLA